MKIVTGKTGKQHVTSADDRVLNQAIWGESGIISGERPLLIDANTLRVTPCEILHQGCHARILPGDYEDLIIDSGVTGQKRIDLIVARYYMDADGIESMSLTVVKGTAVSSGTPVAPDIYTGDINAGAAVADLPLWSILIDNLSVGDPEQICASLPNMKDKVSHGEAYSKDETDAIVKEANSHITKVEQAVAAIGNIASKANDTAQSAAKSAQSAATAAKSASDAADAAQIGVEQNADSIEKTTKIAKTGRVISKTSRIKTTIDANTGISGDMQIFEVPAGTNGVFAVVKKKDKGIDYYGYDYTLDGNGTSCKFQINAYNNAATAGSIELVVISIGPAASLVQGV